MPNWEVFDPAGGGDPDRLSFFAGEGIEVGQGSFFGIEIIQVKGAAGHGFLDPFLCFLCVNR